jgi:hypothetical protein
VSIDNTQNSVRVDTSGSNPWEDITVEQGCITVESITLLYSSNDARVYDVECAQKRPQFFAGHAHGPEGSWCDIMLFADDNTLDVEDRGGPTTRVTLPLDDAWDWHAVWDKYGPIIYAIRCKPEKGYYDPKRITRAWPT